MKNPLLILFCLFISNSAIAQYSIDWSNAPLNPIPISYTWDHFNIKGNVLEKSGKYNFYYFTKEGKLTEIKAYDIENFKYDKEGNLEHKLVDKTKTMTKYVCDSKGRVVKSVLSNGNTTKYTYNEKGLFTQSENDKTSEIFHKYSYDKMGRVITHEEFMRGSLQNVTTYSYKKSGKNLEVVITEKIPGQQASEDTNIYNQRGDCISNAGNPIKYEYDKQNNILKSTYGGIDVTYKYLYQ